MKNLTMYFVDAGGRPATMSVKIRDEFSIDDAEVTAIVAAAQAASDATLRRYRLDEFTINGDYVTPTDGPYSVRDGLKLLWVTATGSKVLMTISAVTAAVFTNDEVVNQAHALFTALKAAALAAIGDHTGVPVDRLYKVWRDRGATPKQIGS